MEKDALLALEDGSLFYGKSIGVDGEHVGEVVFNTAMTGYQEILTDPSYCEQIINFTAPHIGNTGINLEDFESKKIWANGVITRSASPHFSSWRGEGTLSSWLFEEKKIGISGIDTRGLTHLIREKGSLKGCIMAGRIDEVYAIKQARSFCGIQNLDLTSLVTTNEGYFLQSESKSEFHVAVIDFGVKQNILNNLRKLGCDLSIMPAFSTAEEILSLSADGVVLSNGPGDPSANAAVIETVQSLIYHDIPILGICFGHQLLAIASGAKCIKMKFGHHGANHPVIDLDTKRVFLSSQNHGFVIHDNDLPDDLKVTHRSLFDETIAGLQWKNKPIFGFQGHPEASPGPHDLHFLFKGFIKSMKEAKCRNVLTSNLS